MPMVGNLIEAIVSAATSGDRTIIAASAGKTVRIYKCFIVSAASVALTFKDGATAMTGAVSLIAGNPLIMPYDDFPWFSCSTGNAFVIGLSGAVQISGRIYYRQD